MEGSSSRQYAGVPFLIQAKRLVSGILKLPGLKAAFLLIRARPRLRLTATDRIGPDVIRLTYVPA